MLEARARGRVVHPPKRSGAPHPTGAPIRRDSKEAGTFEEAEFFVLPQKGEPDRLLKNAETLLDVGRRLKREEREGRKLSKTELAVSRLTAAAIRVYKEFCTYMRLCDGKVYPTYQTLAEKTALSRSTIGRVLPLLKNAELLVVQRRFKRADDSEGQHRYKQTSSVYRPTIAERIAALIPWFRKPAPPPAEEIARANEAREETARMLDELNCAEFARHHHGDSDLGRTLQRLGAKIDAQAEERAQCESYITPQPLHQII